MRRSTTRILLALSVALVGLTATGPSVLRSQIHEVDAPGDPYPGPAGQVPPRPIPPYIGTVDCSAYGPSAHLPLLQSTTCGPACASLDAVWEATPAQCVGCLDGDGSGECFRSVGASLTFGGLKAFCASPSCPGDLNGDVTTCLTLSNVCEVHVFESSWINHVQAGLRGKPICAPVRAQVCVNGEARFHPPRAFDEERVAGLDCTEATVCITVNRKRLCDAVDQWNVALSGGTERDSEHFFHIGFTRCTGCPC